MSHKDRIRKLVAKLERLAGPAAGIRAELACAVADVERIDAMRIECGELDRFLDEATDGDGLGDLVTHGLSQLSELERATEQLASEPLWAIKLFKQPPERAEVLPSSSAPDDSWRQQRIVWRLGNFDLTHPKNWLELESPDAITDLLKRLGDLELNTWSEIDSMSKHNHAWDGWAKWEKGSQDKIKKMNLDDQNGWYQIQMDRMGRLIGFRVGHVFNLVWWDRDHEVYKTGR
ncbi:hypothetical protein [Sorangium sp. So ce1151]|uniref:hypothetical protein n=1 Tax=Sorangium sp. So ce1151 TaxID=3133332 RepID=UPI003F601BFF